MREEVKKLPDLFLSRLENIFPGPKYHQLVNTFAFKKPVSFRINSLRISNQEVKEVAVKYRIKLFPVLWFSKAYFTNDTIYRIMKMPLFENGLIYAQSLSSMLPALVLSPQNSHTVLDMAAAPGGKTTQMSVMMENQGLIVAYDNNQIRIEKLLYNIEKQQAKNVVVRMGDASEVWKEYPEYFDKILLDAPCSSEGRFYINEPKTYEHWSEKFIKRSSELQKKMIAGALVSLKIGGELVYSSCTFAPEENEEVIDWVVQMVGDRIELMDIPLKISNILPSVRTWQGKNYAKKVNKTVRIAPTREMGGFFIAKIRKIKKIVV